MPNYEKLYHLLFNAITDALESIDKDGPACEILKQAQCECEELYIEGEK